MKATKIRTPLRYPGGKTRAADMLVSKFPDFDEYREPFVGGGSVFIAAKNKFPEKSFWINDFYFDVFLFWGCIKDYKDDVINQVKAWKAAYTVGKDLYSFLMDNLMSFNEIERAAAFFVLNRITFSGTSLSGGYSQGSFDGRFTDTSIKRAEAVSPFLSGVKITNEDYSYLLRDSGSNVILFLDPPYYTATKSKLYGSNGELHVGFDHERLAKEVKECPHRFLMTYDDCEYIRELYKDFTIEPFVIKYGMRNWAGSNDLDGKEITIRNY